jgi:DNA repair protein RecO (recombination protein O)
VSAVQVLASEHGEALQPALRAFELLLLREIGFLPALDTQTYTMAPLVNGERYSLVPEGGLVRAQPDDGRTSLEASQWRALERTLGQGAGFGATLREAAGAMNELKPQLRALLHYHCGVSTLRTRQLMMDLQAL